MTDNIAEIADLMCEMEESFHGMSEEAKDGSDYAQNSNQEAYEIMKRSEEERKEVEDRANAVEKDDGDCGSDSADFKYRPSCGI